MKLGWEGKQWEWSFAEGVNERKREWVRKRERQNEEKRWREWRGGGKVRVRRKTVWMGFREREMGDNVFLLFL